MARYKGAEAIYAVADLFRQRCLAESRSLLWPDRPAWTVENISRLYSAFTENPDEGERSFFEKWRDQLADEPEDVHRVAADVIAFYFLFPTNIGRDAKLAGVREVASWKLAGDPIDWAMLEEAFARGLGHAGLFYLTGRPWQVAFYLDFARILKTEDADPSDPERCKRVADAVGRRSKEGGSARSARNALLHLLFPDLFERTVSDDHKRRMVAAFPDEAGAAADVDDALLNIRYALQTRRNQPNLDFYDDLELRAQWDVRPKRTPKPAEPGGQSAGEPPDDRLNPDVIRAAVEEMYPDPEARRICLTVLADGIERAHLVSPASWGVSWRGSRRIIRLNVSWMQASYLSEGELYLVLDQEALDEDAKQLVDSKMPGPEAGAVYRSTPFAYGAHLPTDRLQEFLSLVRDAHLSFVDRSAGQVRTRGHFYRSHSPGVLAYLREELGRDIPDPDYGIVPAKPERIWLFQANPHIYNLAAELTTKQIGDEDDWSLSRYREQMSPGDTVLLWQAGPDAGIYAVGEIIGEPFERPTAEFWPDREQRSDEEWAIPFRYTRILPEPIARDELRDHPILNDMQVLRVPQGTNFEVTYEQWEALRPLLDELPVEPQVRTPPPVAYVEPPFPQIVAALRDKRMRVRERDVRRYHAALRTRGFVILSGLSGTGKTWLAEAYAEAVGARALVVPVAPNWTSNEDLIGYHNPLTETYHDTAFSRFLREAADAHARAEAAGVSPQPFHVVLDEMNLARVEHYFARFLSAMELRARANAAAIELGPGDAVPLSPNLFVVGTVNVDETTHGFADKVYDRAQLIELEARRDDLHAHLAGAPYRDDLMAIWDHVREVGPFAFRVVDEIGAYVDAASALGASWEEAVDEQLVQKVLPKLKGADHRVGTALERVAAHAGDRFPLCRAKAEEMLEGFRQHGFASYFR